MPRTALCATLLLAITGLTFDAAALDFAKVPRDLKKAPDLKSAKPQYVLFALGAEGSKVLTVVFDESGGTGKGYDTVYFDKNLNGDLSEPDEKAAGGKDGFKVGPIALKDADGSAFTFNLQLKLNDYTCGFNVEVLRPGQAKPAQFGMQLLPTSSALATAETLAKAPVYHLGGPLNMIVAPTTFPTAKVGDYLSFSISLGTPGSLGNNNLNFYNASCNGKQPQAVLRVLKDAKVIDEVPFTGGCACGGGYVMNARVPSRVPPGKHQIVVQEAASALQPAVERVYEVNVENPLYGKLDPDPLIAEAQNKFPKATVLNIYRGADLKLAGGASAKGEFADAGGYSVRNDHGNDLQDSGAGNLRLGTWFGGDNRVFLKPGLSMLPKGAKVQSALLKIYLHNEGYGKVSGPGAIRAYPILRDWGEGGAGHACWTYAHFTDKDPKSVAWGAPGCEQPGVDRGEKAVAELKLDKDFARGFVTLDVTEQVKAWAGGAPNNGLLLKVEGAGEMYAGTMLSSEIDDAPFRPKLILAYEP